MATWVRARTGLSWTLLAYALVLGVLLLIPPTLHGDVGPWPGFTWQEAFDLLTPLLVMPLAWSVLDRTGGLRRAALVAFVVIAALWVDAHGIHLAANAMGDVFAAGAPRDAFYATDVGRLDHFLDEDLGHWMWHVAWAGLELLMLTVAIGRRDWPGGAGGVITVLAGLVHGFTFFLVTSEGGTAALGIPVSVAILVACGRESIRGSTHPIVRFLAVSTLFTLVLYGGWAFLNGGRLVEPCSVLGC